MPLYDVTHSPFHVDADDCEDYDVIQCLIRKLSAAEYARVLRIIRSGIRTVKPSKASALRWTRAAALYGHDSELPFVQELWDLVISAVGDDKECLQAVGALLRMEIARLPDTWLVYRRDSDEYDPATGKLITISEYWVNNDFVFVPPTKRPRSRKGAPRYTGPAGLSEQLAHHFGADRRAPVLNRVVRRGKDGTWIYADVN